MEPTSQSPTPTPAPAPAPGQSLVEYIRLNSQNAAMLLLGFSLLFLALGGWASIKYRTTANEVKKDEKDAKDKKAPFEELTPESAKTVEDPNRKDYIVGAIGSGLLFLVCASGGVWLLARVRPLDEAKQRTEIRAWILAVGGLFGMALILIGGAFFYSWVGSLTDWLDKDETKQARWVLIPLLVIATGAGIAFLTAQPARAEERNNSNIRRLVYGTNLILSILLLFVVLIVVNVGLGRRLPNRLDTTEASFYTISTASKEFLTRLDQPITAYAILPSGSQTSDDIRRLLQTCSDVEGTKLKVKVLSPTQNKKEISELKGKFPVLEVNDFGVLLTAGEDEKRHAFIREDEFVEQDRGAGGRGGNQLFVGEGRLMKELQFLAENQTKPVIYFTQSAGELDIAGRAGRAISETSTAAKLKEHLERNYLDVRPLKFEIGSEKVPDDAAVVIVADPRAPLSEGAVGALRKYMTQPLPSGRKGKLIVLSGARYGPDGNVVKTGLEQFLNEFGVELTNRAIFGVPTQQFSVTESVVGVSAAAVEAPIRNPVAVSLGEKFMIVAPGWRVIEPGSGNPTNRPISLLLTEPGRPTWVETSQPTNLNQVWNELRERREVRIAKQLTDDARSVAVLVSEGNSGRLAVIGNGMMISDAAFKNADTTITYDLLGAIIDWLRERPALNIAIDPKVRVKFTFPATTDETRGLWLPLLFTLIVVGGAGAGVWVVRRK